jgi:hypothetical protein
MYEIWRWSNFGLAFAMELAGLAAFAWWGWTASSSTVLRLLLAVGLPVIGAVLWGLFAAQAGSTYGGPVVTPVFKVVFFGLAGLAIWTLDHPVLAVAFVLVVAANLLIIHAGDLTAGVTN